VVAAAGSEQARIVADVATPGLQNQTGEYNCFLNVIVQCLWHCREFRTGLLSLDPRLLQVACPPVWKLASREPSEALYRR
jgi:hypothetical protein